MVARDHKINDKHVQTMSTTIPAEVAEVVSPVKLAVDRVGKRVR
jgi:hypothetical protein